MNSRSRPFDDRIDAYVDGQLTGQELEQFEHALRADNALALAVDRSEAIRASLRRMFEPPAVPGWVSGSALQQRVMAAADDAERRDERSGSRAARSVGAVGVDVRGRRSRRWLAAAAAVLLTVTGGLLLWTALRPASVGHYDSAQYRTFAQVYAELDEPQIRFESNEQLSGLVRGRFGQAIRLETKATQGVTVDGLATCHTLSRDTMCLVATADGQRTLVFIDRLERDIAPVPDPDGGLQVFRRELGKLVLYEVTRNDRAMLLDSIYN